MHVEQGDSDMALPLTQGRHSYYTQGKDIMNQWSLIYHLKTIWLFTLTDLKTIVGPMTTFGVINALYAPNFGLHSASNTAFLSSLSTTAFWTWINLLPFAIDNQRQVGAVEEDRLNKPWRPLPSERLTPKQAEKLVFILYPVAFVTSILYGGWRQNLALMALGYWYNDRQGADLCISRNFINACGFVCYASGALEVALGVRLPLRKDLAQWFLVIGGVVFSTVQTQDMYDQAGDLACRRRTLPLVVGDGRSRWITALLMVFWSSFCPWYWDTRLGMSAVVWVTGLVIAFRMLLKRKVMDDKTTFKIWNAWMVLLYLLPIIEHATL